MRRDADSIADMLDAVGLIRRYTECVSREQFESEFLVQDAVIRRFEVLGEAANRVSPTTPERFSEIPWSLAAAMRNRMIHDYDAVDAGIVWDTVQQSLPELADQLERVLRELPND